MYKVSSGDVSAPSFILETALAIADPTPRRQLLEAGFDKVAVTRSGRELFADRPDVLEAFAESAAELLGPDSAQARKNYHPLGAGRSATVYQRDPEDDYCIKVSTLLDARRGNKPKNLALDLRFMNLIHHRLAARADEHNVHASPHYAAVGLTRSGERNYALLQRKLPADLVSIRTYFSQKLEFGDWAGFDEASRAIKSRFVAAIGSHVVMLGVNDLMVSKTGYDALTPNGGNIYVNPTERVQETPIHVIDLVRNHGLSRLAANWLGRLAA